jgi:uncharacterized protein YeaO (DUF488 family)
MLKVKRVYDPPSDDDGLRILVDRVWPRGLTKERARVNRWMRELAPSPALRKWFNHDPVNWGRFRQRYRAELRSLMAQEMLRELADLSRRGTVTLVYGSREERYNNAQALKDFVAGMGKASKGRVEPARSSGTIEDR